MKHLYKDLFTCHLSRGERMALYVMNESGRGGVSIQELCAELYGSYGAAEAASARALVSRIRRRIEPLGYTIGQNPGGVRQGSGRGGVTGFYHVRRVARG